VKRVAQELGGKSPNIILADADFETAVRKGVEGCFGNSGQSCDAPTRMLVPNKLHAEALAIAKKAAEAQKVGDPKADDTVLGPVVSQVQFDKIQRLIQAGITEGATLVTGGTAAEGLNRGMRPTVFGNANSRHDDRARGLRRSFHRPMTPRSRPSRSPTTRPWPRRHAIQGHRPCAGGGAPPARVRSVELSDRTTPPFGATNSLATAAITPIGPATTS
jgi:hypothetical protein